ncbi:alanine racemase [Cellulomonas oligotrophica]|uniref:Alanine racemase n=1 Tax=Cellulomonas oligotrophica TaxID=931536 RepID=A0A7Y9FFA1_9CELL|nr:alanine racemase [Cellulomonas oligotrophica]NYD86246.1 alanine racemase [Cellulomonas oligotrophica]GIG34427.1 alanine racemase [Cellulomonas oligotrophica]
MSALAYAQPRTGSRPTLTVDLGAVAANTAFLVGRVAGEVMAVVKADGFGHGMVDVARTALAAGATRLGVTSLEEAGRLREAGLRAPVLSWLNPVDADWAAALAHGVDVAVPGRDHLDAVVRAAPGARVHLQVDTGMARDGAAPHRWADLCRAARAAERRGLVRVVGVMGHLACADQPGHPANADGRARFAWAVATARAAGLRPADRHLASTAAALLDPGSHHTLCRVGAGLVGIDPSGTTALRAPLTLTAPLVDVRDVPAGCPVGYGHTWTAPAPTRLGLLPLGYADGLPRTASGRAEVLVRGRRRPVVGRISMDMTVVDLGADGTGAGETVTVLGPGDDGGPTLREWAAWSGTIEHEIVTGLGARLVRTVRPAGPRGL